MFSLSVAEHVPTVAQTVEILKRHTSEFGVPMDYDRMREYEAFYGMKAYKLKAQILRDACVQNLTPDDLTQTVFKDILRKLGVSTGLLMTQKNQVSVGADSLNAAISTGLYSDEVNNIMSMYNEASGASKAVSMFAKVYEKNSLSKELTYDSHRMIIVHPLWVPQNTGRIGAQEPGIMNFSKAVHDIFTVPKGYVYMEVDSGQIEPRIIQSAYLNDEILKRCTMLYNDAYYGYIHYCKVLTDAERYGSKDVKLTPIEITEEMKALRKKFKTFGNATMYGSTENVLHDPDKAAFIKYIGGHPNRIKWQKQIEAKLDRGTRVFESAFGTPVDITKGPSDSNYDKGSDAYYNHLVKCAINNPIQATGADLMRYSVSKADELLRTKAPKSHITQYVHDAGKFVIHEDDYDKVIDDLREITAYQVEGWIPIYAEAVEGIKAGDVPRFVA